MKHTPQADGTFRFQAGDVATHRATLLDLPALTLCRFCSWRFFGSVRVGRELHASHRSAAHPWARDRGVKARKAAAKAQRPTLIRTEREL